MNKNDTLDLNLDYSKIKNYGEYRKIWEKVGKVQVKMVEKNEQCMHNIGDTFIFDTPYSKPEKICNALLHVLNLYLWRVTFGFPSWNIEDKKVYKLHCPDPKGTIWEMKKL